MTQSVIINERISRELHAIQDDLGQVLAEALDGVMSLLLENRNRLGDSNNLLDVLEDSHTSDEEKRLAIARLSELICILLPE